MIKEFLVDQKKYYLDTETFELNDDQGELYESTNKKNIYLENFKPTEVTIYVTNQCNGSCLYCYEKRSDHKVSIDDAMIILHKLQEKCDTLNKVRFFGGEPLLNFCVLKFLTEEIEKKYEKVDFEITTNGVLIDEGIADFLSKYNYKVIISIDGPQQIHDFLRVGCAYEKVMNAIQLLKKTCNQNKLMVNCTYTKVHKDNLPYDELKKFFESLGINYCVNDVITDKENLMLDDDVNIYKSIDSSYENLKKGCFNQDCNSIVMSVINALVKQQYSDFFCDEICTGFSIYADGELYPCTKLNQKVVLGKNEFNRKTKKICQTCWAKGLCRRCSAAIYLGEEEIGESCEYQDYYEYAILKFLEYLENDAEEVQKIIDNYYT